MWTTAEVYSDAEHADAVGKTYKGPKKRIANLPILLNWQILLNWHLLNSGICLHCTASVVIPSFQNTTLSSTLSPTPSNHCNYHLIYHFLPSLHHHHSDD